MKENKMDMVVQRDKKKQIDGADLEVLNKYWIKVNGINFQDDIDNDEIDRINLKAMLEVTRLEI